MYLEEETYAAAAGFVMGYDEACEGGLLAGFREWLILRLGMGSNLAWPALVLHAAFPQAESPQAETNSGPKAQRHAIDTLFGLVAEFDDVRAKHDGLRKVYLAYEQWARQKGID
jgi:hypothetical protein